MLTLSEEKLREIARLAKQCIGTDKTRSRKPDLSGIGDDPKPDLFESPSAEEMIEIIFNTVPSLPETKLSKLLDSLSHEEMCQLMALIWLGRDHYPHDSVDIETAQEQHLRLYREACQTHDQYSVEYVSGKYPLLSEYIERGMFLLSLAEKEAI